MNRSRRNRASDGSLSQPVSSGRRSMVSLSQPVPSTSSSKGDTQAKQRRRFDEPYSPAVRRSTIDNVASEEDNQLVNSMIRYIFIMDRGKQVIAKARVVKNVLGGQGKHFHRLMVKVTNILSEIFGYNLVEVESNKFILVNEIQNDTDHIQFSNVDKSRQVLLFIVLTHIFMRDESCGEELLWEFLRHLGIISSDNFHHRYFGNVKQLITQDFVAQNYLIVTSLDKDDPSKTVFKWGPRAEHEFSRRAALQFVSQIYGGRAINSWPLQFKTMEIAEKLQ